MKAYLRALAPRDLRAFIALWASIGGAMALTCVAIWLVWILWRGGWAIGTETARIDKIGLALILILVIMGITVTSFGLAINRRQLKGSAFGASFEASGGDDAVPVQVVNPPNNPVQTEEAKP
jgi:formate hydrogenlyase subunit 3/multisubunit Na+/H+ antiporter MnhD subunit